MTNIIINIIKSNTLLYYHFVVIKGMVDGKHIKFTLKAQTVRTATIGSYIPIVVNYFMFTNH